MDKNKKYMAQTLLLAKENAGSVSGGPFAAIIVKDNEIVGAAVNSVTTDKDPTAHAEINAIRTACSKLDNFDLTGCTLYSSCEPCPMCLSAAYWAHIDKIYFSADRNDAERAGFSDAFIYDQLSAPLDKLILTLCQLASLLF